MNVRHVIGCMTGTSIDGLDCALVAVSGQGLDLRGQVVRTSSRPLAAIGDQLRALAEQRAMTAGEIARLAREFSLLHLDAVRELAAADLLDLVAVHGQTVFHAPPLSWQLFTAAPLAHGLGVPVVHDLRAADLAAGGQGAPITPLADWLLLRGPEPRAVVNLGGFCNVTHLPAQGGSSADIAGGDVCACNHLLDTIARSRWNTAYDADGARAGAGRADPWMVERFAAALAAQARARRSLGTGDELTRAVEATVEHDAGDVARSACAAIAVTIASATSGAGRLILAGGGARNRALVAELRAATREPVAISDELGLPHAYREAAAMAVLGALCQDRVAITLPTVTGVGAPAPIAGIWCLP